MSNNKEQASVLVDKIAQNLSSGETVKLMEVCGTHTVSLMRSGVRFLLEEKVPHLKLISGPGCPVCVTSQGYIDTAVVMAMIPDVIICTYGDMVRVPGKKGSLEKARAEGAEVEVVYSSMDAVRIAEKNPDKEVIFLGIGFETTTPATAGAIIEADKKDISNFSVLASHKLMNPAMEALLSDKDAEIDGFILPGHVSVMLGAENFRPVVDKYGKSCVVIGFEPINMLKGIEKLTSFIADKKPQLDNVYGVAVSDNGNPVAAKWIDEVFVAVDEAWRAIGVIPKSGLALNEKYSRFDALKKLNVKMCEDYEPKGCKCGDVIQGKAEPNQCSLFKKTCTPSNPIGPCMVSSEGSCAAWYKYGH